MPKWRCSMRYAGVPTAAAKECHRIDLCPLIHRSLQAGLIERLNTPSLMAGAIKWHTCPLNERIAAEKRTGAYPGWPQPVTA
jgi:hypothetical protein